MMASAICHSLGRISSISAQRRRITLGEGTLIIANQLAIAVPECVRQLRWSIAQDDFPTPGMGNGNPEHCFPMVAPVNHLQSSIDCHGTSGVADIGCERERRLDCARSSIEDARERRKVPSNPVSAHLSNAQQFQQRFMEAQMAIVSQQLPHRHVSRAYRGVLKPATSSM